MKKRKLIFLLLLILSIITISGYFAMAAPSSSVLSFIKPSGAIARSEIVDCTGPGLCTKYLTCTPSDSNECCNEQGQYYITWTSSEGLGTVDCRPSTTCAINSDNTKDTVIANAFIVNWEVQQYCTSGCTGKPANEIAWNVGRGDSGTTLSTCCGDDPNEYYQSPANGKSCDGISSACCNAPNRYARAGSPACTDVCADISNTYFTDMANNKFTPAKIADVRDYVKLVAKLLGVDDGMEIEFVMQGNKAGTKCYLQTSADPQLKTGIAKNNNASTYVQIKNCNIPPYDGQAPDSVNFSAYIKTQPSKINWSSEGNMSVDATEENSPPNAIIDTPQMTQVILLSQKVNFNSSSWDEDDPLFNSNGLPYASDTFTWNLDVFETPIYKNTDNTSYTYTSGGPKVINLVVKDARGASADTRIGIEIDTPAVNDLPSAFILKPKYNERISGVQVEFDATPSTDDKKNDRSPTCDSTTGTCWRDLKFEWSMDDGFVKIDYGMAGAKFTRLFEVGGEHTATLTVDDGDPRSEYTVKFFLEGCTATLPDGSKEYIPYGACSSKSGKFFCDLNGNVLSTFDEACDGGDGKTFCDDYSPDCCPNNYYCPGVGKGCVLRTLDCPSIIVKADCECQGCAWINGGCDFRDNFTSCTSYITSTDCANDILGLGKTGGKGLGTEICGTYAGDASNFTAPQADCKCIWDASTGCRFENSWKWTESGNTYVTCSKNFSSLSQCLEGKQILEWQAKCTDTDGGVTCGSQTVCKDGTKTINCATSVSAIPFFSLSNMLAAVIVITAYYCYKGFRKNHKNL